LESDPVAALAIVTPPRSNSRRLGFSGPPGAGKSSLIAAWAGGRLSRGERLGVLAIDPSSPLSHGSVLGDRARMGAIADHPGFYLRSVPSRSLNDGLCPNAAAMLDEMDLFGFDAVVLETVGVGQADYAMRSLVDTFVMVLNPEGGDIVQAMKAGILEVADILVVNKADLPSAKRMAVDVASIVEMRRGAEWRPPVIEISSTRRTGLEGLESALSAHAHFLAGQKPGSMLLPLRQRYRLQKAMEATIDKVLGGWSLERFERPPIDLLIEAFEEALASERRSCRNGP
jgi:LAO/AO transport system kinase